MRPPTAGRHADQQEVLDALEELLAVVDGGRQAGAAVGEADHDAERRDGVPQQVLVHPRQQHVPDDREHRQDDGALERASCTWGGSRRRSSAGLVGGHGERLAGQRQQRGERRGRAGRDQAEQQQLVPAGAHDVAGQRAKTSSGLFARKPAPWYICSATVTMT